MTVDELVRNYPRLYHMATGGSWSAIREHGLLPTSSIVQTSGLPVERRMELLTQARTVAATFTHPVLGSVTVRDQTPLRGHILASVLTDVTSSQWIGLLNSRVFFWLHPDRLRGLLCARRSRHQLHDVIMVDTRRFVEAYQDRIELSSINSGSTLYPNAPRRGSQTFLPIAQYPFAERRRSRPLSTAVVELTVVGGVPDLATYVVGVDRYEGPDMLGPLHL
jgi:hypothetical protein